ncbi:hypothetical protein F7R91_05545 [Streptomyces luteolifulvus]|uniref:Transmembrane protein n=1 Tax=Streptomyces luteolifulvus TaxID=2615112 RepID=A0A6H9V651_9ACTN|nr:hypothetical protein [Streptomyces luteolifulvus]KAB1149222.1 hypothetical protein F7R91_05545 [Streptomyces luteolifulvus]
MTDPTPLAKAEAAVREATVDTAAVQVALAAVELAKLASAQPQHQGCQHTPQQQFDARKWLTIGGLAIVGGCVACALALAFALASIAIAIGATCATGCFIVLRSMWRDYIKTR